MVRWANYNEDYIQSRSTVTENGCWEWNRSITRDGYGQAGHPTEKRAHRLSWTIFKGPIPLFDIVCHKCDNRKCVNPDHLFLGSHGDNLQDAVNKGRIDLKARSDHANSFLRIPQQTVEAVVKYASEIGGSQSEIAKQFNISQMSVSNILRKTSNG